MSARKRKARNKEKAERHRQLLLANAQKEAEISNRKKEEELVKKLNAAEKRKKEKELNTYINQDVKREKKTLGNASPLKILVIALLMRLKT